MATSLKTSSSWLSTHRTWILVVVAVTIPVGVVWDRPSATPSPAGQDPRGNQISPRPPLHNPRSNKQPSFKRANLIERVVLDNLNPRPFQEVMVTVELKAGIDASKALIFIAGKVGNPRIVRFFRSGEDRVQVFVEAGGAFDTQEVKIKVAQATQLRTAALLEVRPYAFRANTVEFKVTRPPRGPNKKFLWSFGDGQTAMTDVPWTTHSYPVSAELKTYQASVRFDRDEASRTADGETTTNVRPRGPGRTVTLRETVVRWPRPAARDSQRTARLSGVSPQARRRQTKLRDIAIGYEVYQAMKVLGTRQVTIEDLYRLKQEGRIKPWVQRRAAAAQQVSPEPFMVRANYVPQSNDELDRLAEELFGPGYEFQYVPGRLVNARKGDLYLVEHVDVPGVTAIIKALGQTYSHVGMMAEDQYTVRDMSANGKSPHPKKAGELYRGSETDYSDPLERIPFRLNPRLLSQQTPGIRERSVDEAIVSRSLLLDSMLIVKPIPENEKEDRPKVEAVVESARRIESSVGLPGVYVNYYKVYAFTDVQVMGMCSSYVWTAAQETLNLPVFDYSPALRRRLSDVLYDDTRKFLFKEAWEEAGGSEVAGEEGDVAVWLKLAGLLDIFATNAANQIVNTFGWDDSDNLSHDWADFTDEQIGWSHTVSPDNMRPRWFDVQTDQKVPGWGRPWGYEEAPQYELGSYRAVRRGGSDSDGRSTGPTTASRFKFVLDKLKCMGTEEVTDEVYMKLVFKNSAGRIIQSFTTRVYEDLKDGSDDDPNDGDEENFTERDRENVGWIDIGDGVTVEVSLWEEDGADSPDDKLGSNSLTIRAVTIPAGSSVLFGEPPGRAQGDPGNWGFSRKDPNPFVSDWKYRVWFHTIYAGAQ